jgi:hypothetical protein
VKALQGEKESIGYEAHRIATGSWPTSVDERAEIRDALCLAAIFEGSDRSQAIVYRALKQHPSEEREQLKEAIVRIVDMFDDAERAEADMDLDRGWRRLKALSKVLRFDDVTAIAEAHIRAGHTARKA